MPNYNSTRFEVALYTEPDHEATVQNALGNESDDCLLLDIERLVGLHIAAANGDRTAAENLRQLRRYAHAVDYGADVTEAYEEGRS